MLIEKLIRDYLLTKLSGTSVYTEKPDGAVGKCVFIEKTGSSHSIGIDCAIVAVQSWDSSLENAAVLNESVKEYMLAMPDEVTEIMGVRLNSDYNFTNTLTKQHRYQAVFAIYY